ncbi:tryptophan-rich sensory protein [Pseudonocardia sp. KRD-291]|nr:tryptophan-rich sensory protein [Pseudonocardia sp. KRD291]
MAGFVVAVVVVAAVGGLAASNAGADYLALQRPTWAPPAWLFGPVWSVLYFMIAVAGWLVWRSSGWPAARLALAVYALQLVLNLLWTPMFFGLGSIGLAAIEIVVLWLSVVTTIVLFARHTRLGAVLLLPYLGWVTFAGALNIAIWTLN